MLGRPALAVSIAGFDPGAAPWARGGVKEAIVWAASLGVRRVHLDGAMPGLRARELGRSARRDLGAFLRRREISLDGIDLWIPPPHFADPDKRDRAIAAAAGAIGLCADLRALGAGGPALCVSIDPNADEARSAIVAEADRAGVAVADHEGAADDAGGIHVGVDPALEILAGRDPSDRVLAAGQRLACARLSDADAGSRVEPGRGRLDENAYLGALAACNYERSIVLDPRGLRDPSGAATRLADRWVGAR